jgi:hypothetical protein
VFFSQAKTVYPGGCSKGELTLLGQKQARDLGRWLQERYINIAHFLPATYHVGVHWFDLIHSFSSSLRQGCEDLAKPMFPHTFALLEIGIKICCVVTLSLKL